MAATFSRWLFLFVLTCVPTGQADDKKIELDWLSPVFFDEVEALESATSSSPATKEQIKQLTAKRRVVGRVLKVNGKVEGYVIYALRPEGYHILRMAAYDRGNSDQVESKLINELRTSLEPTGRLFITADSTAISDSQLKVLQTGGFNKLTPTQREAAKEAGFPSRANLVFQANQDRFSPTQIQQLTHFQKFGVNMDTEESKIEARFRMLQALYPATSETGRALEEAHTVLTHPLRRTDYVRANASRLKEAFGDFVTAEPPQPDSLDFYERLGRSYAQGALYTQAMVRRDYEKALVELADKPEKHAALEEALYILKDPTLSEMYEAILATTTGNDRTLALGRFLHEWKPGKYSRPDAGSALNSKQPVESGKSLPYSESDPNSMNLFQRLGVAENASSEKVLEGFLKVFSKYSSDAKAKKNLIEAFQVLTNDQTRVEYERLRSREQAPTKAELRQLIQTAKRTADAQNSVPPPAFDGGRYRRDVLKPVPNAQSYYARLGVAENASRQKIIDAYIGLLPLTKPGSAERESVVQAYGTLSDPDLRDAYDDIFRILDPKARANALAEFETDFREGLTYEEEMSSTSKSSFYRLLGVSSEASYDLIEKRFLDRFKTSSPEERAELATAFSVLRDAQLRKEYDLVTRRGTVDGDISHLIERGKELDSLRALRGEMKSAQAKSSLSEFVKQTGSFVDHLYKDPKTAREYLGILRTLIRSQGSVPSSALQPAIGLLEQLKLRYGSLADRPMAAFRSGLLELRGELAQKVIEAARAEGVDPAEYYPGLQQGDLVNKLIADSKKTNQTNDEAGPAKGIFTWCFDRFGRLTRRNPEDK